MPIKRYFADALPDAVSAVAPSPLSNMKGQLFNSALADTLSLPESMQSMENLVPSVFSSDSTIAKNAVAQKYGGHQFGSWNPELGDGRGLLLGEVLNNKNLLVDLHLKGAGQTPYSRFADGRAVLRSTLREYIGGEALHALGIPSTRSLCLISSESNVRRETIEPAAMMIRTAPSHIRFGHFEYFYYADKPEILDRLMTFCLTHHFQSCSESESPHSALLSAIVKRTARLVALWQAYGFIHGVMNTDNMSIHGITFDYGPYAFQGAFKQNAVLNHSDHQGRYAFDQQPNIGLWNCYALSEGFSRYIDKPTRQSILDTYEPIMVQQYRSSMLDRMGLGSDEHSIDKSWPIALSFLQAIAAQSLDYNQAFAWLSQARATNDFKVLRNNLNDIKSLDEWWPTYHDASTDTFSSMKSANPLLIPRTSHLDKLIAMAEGNDWETVQKVVNCYSQPFIQPSDDMNWLTDIEASQNSQLSCSS
ncbi:YdiU family protein [Alteromonas sp. 5E99-2]|uniref:protein adenylyltransferase SelO family protein n=1 Tax=Alteromonas sp. 5E99-2 TaxID=2817683 RepID=UPI001A989883|nr:YdiU family protein [Alteromonas sp. 5E99-2]MBO1255889.1 YdiU family protein [Alteromonas sp. 5E99-2]